MFSNTPFFSGIRKASLLAVAMAVFCCVTLLSGCFPKSSEPTQASQSTSGGVIYQGDSRSDVSLSSRNDSLTRATAILIDDSRLTAPNSQGEPWKIRAPRLKEVYPLCADELFQDQIALGHCSGALIGPKLVLTAGHCLSERGACEKTKFAFGWSLERSLEGQIKDEELFHCQRVVTMENQATRGRDFAIVELDRPVSGVKPLTIASEHQLENEREPISLSHPLGLPLKIDRAKILEDSAEQNTFKAAVDTFSGSSGSPLLDSRGEIVGLLLRGMPDFLEDDIYRVQSEGGCIRFNHCDQMTCFGETYFKPTRIPNIKDLL
jgi:hypothetical protein